ncbi:hybrid non-ribosomal peptide synthetase/type I polyketide synthase [Streptomyces chattanoogensis]|uniref:hybrid non-ribosomal peptide synthetase/type I polyketide synthase n=1 Tax=Streptomyces chattanoogensis TaxID=66876 RepID=UPI0006B49FDD|nr:hybrid non-ribosomal peptide synthetase/type I polyketide synthase [Streptomyces chattanoogensis]
MTTHLPDDARKLMQSALERIKSLTTERDALRAETTEPIAVVGMGARMPGGADDTAALWELLSDGRDAVAPYPSARLADVPGGFPAGVPSGGFLESVDGFDAGFFGVSAREASYLDPQQRLLLEVSWEALENAGARPASLKGSRVGVYVGVTNNDYMQSLLTDVAPEDLEAYALTGNASTFAAGRIAYWLGVHGPGLSVDTACSSSLVAVHLAAQALRSRDADLALAGGVNVLLSPEWYTVLGKANMLSPDAHCKTFDASADGYVRSEGCGVVVLKRLSDAKVDGDRILGVIRGSAVNQDGRASGVTVPNATAQRDVVRTALAASGLAAEDIDYVEAHGTGTALGDPVEVHALADVLCPQSRATPLVVGSVKTNLGHLEPAAGIAGLIKVLLSLHHDLIPSHRGLSEVNPEIDLDAWKIAVPVEGRPWARGERIRRAGISSFGASGTNAHVIVEEAPEPVADELLRHDTGPCVLPLSARTAEGVVELARQYLTRLGAKGTVPDAALADLAYTAGVARDHWPVRYAAVASTTATMRAELRRVADGEVAPVTGAAGRPRSRTAFLFTGQGSQYAGMGADLFESSPTFRESLQHCASLVDGLLDRPLLDVMFASDDPALHDTRYTQPALVALEWSLAQMWRGLGVEPDVVVGHSVGEIAAAAVAGVLDIADALAVAAARGRLMQELTEPGAMAAVFAPVEVVRGLLVGQDRVGLAAVNGPEHTVISGHPDDVHRVLDQATAQGVRSKRLPAGRAFHSPLMRPMLSAFERELAGVTFAAPSVPLVSALTAEEVGPQTWNAAYLLEHALQPVDFFGAMTTVLDNGVDHVLELGPQPTLLATARRFVPEEQRSGLWGASLRPGRPDREVFAATVAEAYTAGLDIDWMELWSGRAAAITDAPTYPFQRSRHWYEPSRRTGTGHGTDPGHGAGGAVAQRPDAGAPRLSSASLLGLRVPTPGSGAAFLTTLDSTADPALADCVIGGEPLVNVGFFLEAAVQAAQAVSEWDTVGLTDVTVLQRLAYDADRRPTVMLTLEPAQDGTLGFAYQSDPADPDLAWPLHCRGRIVGYEADPAAPSELPTDLPHRMTGSEFYRHMWSRRLYLGDGARWVEEVAFDRDHAWARVRAAGAEEARRYVVPPGLIDAMFQVLFAPLSARGTTDSAFMVVGIDAFSVRPGLPAGPLQVRLRMRQGAADAHTIVADVSLLDESGTCWVSASGVTLARAQAHARVSGPPRSTHPWQPVAAIAPPERPAAVALDIPDPLTVVTEACARSLRAGPAGLPQTEPVQNLGLDSLMALEIKDEIAGRCGVAVPLAMFLDGANIAGLAAYVQEQLSGDNADADRCPAPLSDDANVPDDASTQEEAPDCAPPDRSTRGLDIDLADRHEPFELTDLQQAYLVGRSEGLELGGVSTFFFIEVDLRGLDCERLESAVNAAIERHGMLRAVMTDDGRQRVLPKVESYRLDRLDLGAVPAGQLEARLAERSAELSGQVFDPTVWPLFHLAVTHLPDGVTRMHVGIDALVIDAWSTALFFAELAQTYQGQRDPAPLDLTFRDYVRHLRAQESGPEYAAARAYWTDRIAALPPAPELPLCADPAAIGRPEFAHLRETIGPERWERFKAHAGAAGITPSAAIAAAYAETIACWSVNPHFTLTLLFFNRTPVHPEVSEVLGNFSTTTLLEVDTRGSDDFAARGQRLQRQLWSDLEHSAFSGVQVLRELSTLHGSARAGRAPVVFASTLNFSSGEGPASSALTDHLIGLTGEGHEVSSMIRTPQVWLDHQVIEDAGGLRLNWDYVTQLLPEAMVGSMFASYRGLIERLCDDEHAWHRAPEITLGERELAPRRRANATATKPPTGLLHHGFERAVAQRPDAVALVCGEATLTYAELDKRAGALARRIAAGTGRDPEELIAVMLPKGIAQVVAVLAVLKAGKAYVPIAADLPAERARRTLELSGATLTVADQEVRALHPWLSTCSVVDVAEAEAEAEADPDGPAPGAPLAAAAEPDNIAYVIFTSGSTGQPKGVVIEHRAALGTLQDVEERFGIGPADRVLGLSALNFDLSVFDIFGTLAAGGTLVLPRPDQLRDPQAWSELVRRHDVTVWNSVPALLQMMADHLEGREETVPSLRTIMLSGDWIPTDLPDRARRCAPGAQVHSLGGATEAAIWSITYPVGTVAPSWPSIPYGKPLGNQAFHVLDERLRHRPTRVPGELYIAGDGLARGYLGDPGKTAASFVDTAYGRLYRTGDLGRYLPDGTIEFLGRQDGQVKIQGYRIELGEIESVLSRMPGVRGAVAAAIGAAMESKTLVAGVVLDTAETPLDSVTEALRGQLPAYMVPSRLVELDAVPITANGKVDRRALEDQCHRYPRQLPTEPPRDDTERCLAALWSQLLPDAPAGRDDDFFALGGNSLLGVRLISRIRTELGTTLPLSVLFTHPTVAAMAEAVRDGRARRTTLVPMTSDGTGPTSYWIHPVGGDVVCYRDLAQVLGVPVTGVQVPDDLAAPIDLGHLADLYADAIAADATGRHVRIAGWSMGGVLALEVAERMAARGFTVAPVVAIDLMEHPDEARAEPSHAQLLAWFARDVAHIAGAADPLAGYDLGKADAPEAVLAERLRSSGLLGSDTDDETTTALLSRFAANARALSAHRPGSYGAPVVLVRAADGASETVTAAWAAHLTGPVAVHTLDGDHYSVLQADRIEALASTVRAAWELRATESPKTTE